MNTRELRRDFINTYPGLLRKTSRGRVLDQNQQPAGVRRAFIDYVEYMRATGQISERVAFNATL